MLFDVNAKGGIGTFGLGGLMQQTKQSAIDQWGYSKLLDTLRLNPDLNLKDVDFNDGLFEGMSSETINSIRQIGEECDATTDQISALEKGFGNLTKSSKGLTGALGNVFNSILNGLTSLGMSAVISFYVDGIQKLINSNKELAASVQEITGKYSEQSSQISNYYDKTRELQGIMTKSSSTTEEVKNATAELYKIQNDLISQYGAYHQGIDLVNGDLEEQLDLLQNIDRINAKNALTEINAVRSNQNKAINFAAGQLEGMLYAPLQLGNVIKYADNVFRQNKGLWESAEDTLFKSDTFGIDIGSKSTKSSVDQIKSLVENYDNSIKTTNKTALTLAKTFSDAFDVSGDTIKAKGNIYEVNEAVTSLTLQLRDLGVTDEDVFNSLESMAIDTSDKIKTYGDTYNSIVEAEVKTTGNLAKYYRDLTDKRNEYLSAQDAGDTEKVEQLGKEYQEMFTNISESGISDKYIDYFRNLYPELENYISQWEFEVDVIPRITGHVGLEDQFMRNTADELITRYNYFAQAREAGMDTDPKTKGYFQEIERAAADAGMEVEQFIVYMKSIPKYSDNMQHVRDLMGDNFTEDFEKELEGKDLTALVDVKPKTDGLSYTKKEIEDLLSPLELETDIKYNANRDTADKFAELQQAMSPLDTAYQVSMGNNSDQPDMLLKADQINAVVSAMGSLADKEPEFETALRKWQDEMMRGATGAEAQTAYDDLITAYLAYDGTLNNLTDDNKKWAQSMLEELGITDRILDSNGDLITSDNALMLANNALSKSTVRFNNSMKKLDDTLGKHYKTLRESDKGSKDYEDSLSEIKKATQDLFSFENESGDVVTPELSDEFIIKNLENIREAAGGSIEALDELRTAASQEIVANVEIDVPSGMEEGVRTQLTNLLAQLQSEAKDIEVGAYLDESPALRGLQHLCENTGIAAQDMQAMLAGIGIAPEISYQEATVEVDTSSIVEIAKKEGVEAAHAHARAKQSIKIPTIRYKPTGSAAGGGFRGSSSPGSGGGGGGGGGNGGGSGDTAEQSYDWVETAIQRLEREISNLDKVVNSTYENWSKRNNTLANEIKKVTDEIKAQQDAVSVYKQKTNAIVTEYTTGEGALSTDVVNKYVKKIQKGEINTGNINESLETIKGNEKLVDFISKYTEFFQKYLDAVDKQYDLEQQRYSLIEQGFNLVKTEFEKAIEVIADGYSFVDKRINRIQEHGYFVNDSYYNQQIGYKKSEKTQMEKELDALRAYMKKEGASLDPKSEAYQDLMKQIRDLELSIEDAATDLVVLQKTIREAAWERFDWLQGRISNIVDESNFMVEIIGEDRLYDRDTGLFNEKAWATAGLYMTNYDIYAKQVGEYEKEYKRVQKELAKDPNNKEIREHLEEINSQWQEAINNVQEQKQNIKNLVEEGINEYLSKLQEAIDDYKKLLQNAKSLYEWQNTIDEKTENIARLRKQLSVYGGDDSEENRANLQRLNQQLSEAEKDLRETEWDHYIQETESFLDEMYSDMEEFLNKYLEDIDLVVKDIATGVNERGKEISETVKSEAKAVGYNLSDTMNSIFAVDGIVVSTINKNGDLINKISGQVTTVVSAINQLEDTIKKIMVNDETGKKVEDESPKTKDEGQDYKGIGGGTGKVDSKTGLIDIGKNAVRRMYNEKTGEHFYTTSDTEAAALVKAGWKDEGKAWDNEDAKTGVPVYRVYNPIAGDHHYTINKDEVQTLVKAGWKDEGIAFYGAKQGNKVYRVYNPNNGKHHYTLNADEVKKLVSAGWKDEGVAWIANYTSNVQELVDKVNDEIDRNGPINTGKRTSGYLIDRTTKSYATGSEYIDKDQLAWTQDGGGEILYRKKDGAILTPLNRGDKVYTNEMSQRLWELASTTPQSLINNNTVPTVSNLSTTVNQNNSINITLPNVTNYEQFKSALQKDSKFEGFIKEITFGQALGYNSLKKYSY